MFEEDCLAWFPLALAFCKAIGTIAHTFFRIGLQVFLPAVQVVSSWANQYDR